MDRMQRAKNLLIELEALKEHGGTGSPIGTTIVLSLALTDAEILVREILTEMTLREALARKQRRTLPFPAVRQALVSSVSRTLGLRRHVHKDVLSGRIALR